MASTVPTTQPKRAIPPQEADSPAMTPRQIYLIIYNITSFVLWYTILIRIFYPFAMLPAYMLGDINDAPDTPHPAAFSPTSLQDVIGQTFSNTGDSVRWIQSLAALEVVHAVVGLVRAPVVTTGMQVASRFLLVWGVLYLFGAQLLAPSVAESAKQAIKGAVGVGAGAGWTSKVANQYAYIGMLLAWSVTECVRYGYFVFFLANASLPDPLRWLRYNGFFVLYPLGISSEVWLVYAALPFAKEWNVVYYYVLIAALAVYVPGSYILYTHMMAQRRRINKGKAVVKPHAE